MTTRRFNMLTDPVPGMTCGKCGGEVYINGKWIGRKWFVICLRCRIVTLETEEDVPTDGPTPENSIDKLK